MIELRARVQEPSLTAREVVGAAQAIATGPQHLIEAPVHLIASPRAVLDDVDRADVGDAVRSIAPDVRARKRATQIAQAGGRVRGGGVLCEEPSGDRIRL